MISDICEAFKNKAVGSKVFYNNQEDFMNALERAIKKHDWSKDRVKGQTVLDLPRSVNKMVSPGSWYRGSTVPKDFVLRKYRGVVGMYLKRNAFATSKRVRCVVYSRDAYYNDPDFTPDEKDKAEKFFGAGWCDSEFVLVAVLGDPDKRPSTVSYSRFVKNLAGANNEYFKMNKKDVVDLAQRVDDYRKNYVGVSD